MEIVGIGLLDAATEIIWEVEHDQNKHVSARRSHALRTVAGALRRQLFKRFGSDFLCNLTNEIVNEAYLNEVCGVVRDWPRTSDFVRPMTFYGTAHLLRKAFAAHSLSESPSACDSKQIISPELDSNNLVVVRSDENRFLFACPRTIYAWSTYEIEKLPQNPMEMLQVEDGKRYVRDRHLMHSGMQWRNARYRYVLTSPEAFEVLHGVMLHDDDGIYVGDLTVCKVLYPENRIIDQPHGISMPGEVVKAARTFAGLCAVSMPPMIDSTPLG